MARKTKGKGRKNSNKSMSNAGDSDASTLAAGTRVVLHGLSVAAINGTYGTIVRFVPEKDRFAVKLDGGGGTKSIKSMNLRKLDVTDQTYARLFRALREGKLAAVKRLLREGADVNREFKAKTDPNGRTPLIIAAMEDRMQMVKVLLAAGADVNKAMVNGGVFPRCLFHV